MFRKFFKNLSMKIGHDKFFRFAINRPLNRKGRHDDRYALSFEAGGVQGKA